MKLVPALLRAEEETLYKEARVDKGQLSRASQALVSLPRDQTVGRRASSSPTTQGTLGGTGCNSECFVNRGDKAGGCTARLELRAMCYTWRRHQALL